MRSDTFQTALWGAIGRRLGLLASLVCWILPVRGQIVLSSQDVSHLIGEYGLSYNRSNIDLSVLLGTTGSNFWDFSKLADASDVVGRVDVVPVSDGGNGADFANAAFSLRYDGGAVSGTVWEYYNEDSAEGLVFYGTYDPVGYSANPSVPITPPTSVLPALLHFGDSWTNAYSFAVTDPLFGAIPVNYTSSNTVDAYGTMALPGMGTVSALRIAEVEDYDENIFGFDYPQFDTNWIWLAPGIGYAAQAVAYAPDTYSLSAQTYTNSFSRRFLALPLPTLPSAQLKGGLDEVNLAWESVSGAEGYVVESCTNLTTGQWSFALQLTNQMVSFSVISNSQQFFRISAQP